MVNLLRIIDKTLPFDTKRRMIVRFFYNIIKKPQLIVDGSQLKDLLDIRALPKSKREQLPKFENVSSFSEIKKIIFTKIANPLVSIIIPIHNKWVYTYNCLNKLSQNTKNVSYEIIVINDASTDQTSQMLTKSENIRLITNDKNEGFIKNCNKGAAIADGKYLLFLNNDTLVTLGWLSSMVSLFKKHEKVGVVGSKLLFPDGHLQESGGVIWQDASGWNYGRGDDPDKWEYNYVKDVDYCSGCCLLIKKNVFQELGGFDEYYAPAYGEDSDLCFRIRQHGYRVLYQPQAEIVHFEGITAGTDVTSGIKKYQAINRLKFRKKWNYILKKENYESGKNIFLARDRSRNKKIMLIIDHYVPMHDKDAGSLHIYEKIKMFLSMGFKIVFWPDNLQKMEPYTGELQQKGVEVVYGNRSRLFKRYIEEYGQYFHTIFLSRANIGEKYIDKIRKYSNAKVIFFPHDLQSLRRLRGFQITKDKKDLKESVKSKIREDRLIASSDATVVVSKLEKDILDKEHNRDKIFYIPFLFSASITKNSLLKDFDKRQHLLFIGGFVHKPNEDCVLWFAEYIYPLIKKELSEIKLYLVGSNPTKKILQLESSDIIVTGYVQDVAPMFNKAKVFISPLRYGAGVKGKILQSFSYGLPVVTTSVGSEGMNLKHNQHVMIADKPEEFARQTIQLYTNRNLWIKLAKNSLQYLEENHSFKIVNDKYNALFNSLGVLLNNEQLINI
ncbi:MAG: glycosyltransferase [Candidatus Hermodarchaeota archaeon]